MYDVVIVGGGPAGLSAALLLGRCRRRVLECDSGTPRNAASRALHGYLTRDGVPPLELLRLGRDELRQYDIELRQAIVTGITPSADGFDVLLRDGEPVRALTVLLATGIRDELPEVAGLDACYGITAHHCPYCDGWEHREKTIGVIGRGAGGAGLALSLRTCSVMCCAASCSRCMGVSLDGPFVHSTTRSLHVRSERARPAPPAPRPITPIVFSRCSQPSQYGQW